MISAVIIEDEFNALNTLKKLLGFLAEDITIKGEADNVEDAIQLIHVQQPQLVFLDIELIGGNAFKVLEACQEINLKIIFTTAYEQFAIRAFKFETFDYLLKPIDIDELEECLRRLRKVLLKENQITQALHDYKLNYHQQNEEKILLKTTENQYILNTNDIIRCQSDGSYTTIYTNEKQILTSRNLKYYENILSGHTFFRVHQSHLVNLKYVKSINSNNQLTLTDNSNIPVSTRKKAHLKELLKKNIQLP